jgi:hypothetical protein
MVEKNPYLVPYVFSDENATYLYLVNGALDAVDGVPLRFAEQDGTYAISVLPSRGEASEFAIKIGNKADVFCPCRYRRWKARW